MQDHKTLEEYKKNIIGGREAIPQLLDLFSRHGIHATWASVGLLMAENAEDAKKYCPEKMQHPSYTNAKLSSYRQFEDTLLKSDPECFFAQDLVKHIANTEGQEIGSHTFSHYYCREDGQTAQQFRTDILAAKKNSGRQRLFAYFRYYAEKSMRTGIYGCYG